MTNTRSILVAMPQLQSGKIMTRKELAFVIQQFQRNKKGLKVSNRSIMDASGYGKDKILEDGSLKISKRASLDKYHQVEEALLARGVDLENLGMAEYTRKMSDGSLGQEMYIRIDVKRGSSGLWVPSSSRDPKELILEYWLKGQMQGHQKSGLNAWSGSAEVLKREFDKWLVKHHLILETCLDTFRKILKRLTGFVVSTARSIRNSVTGKFSGSTTISLKKINVDSGDSSEMNNSMSVNPPQTSSPPDNVVDDESWDVLMKRLGGL